MKLWQKEKTETSGKIIGFTVGRDKEFDLQLAAHDVQGSMAHVQMLHEVGLISADELADITAELNQIAQMINSGSFAIDEAAEDIHSQIEGMLTERIGEAGKKIHTGRSRNDQVAVDIKLFLRSEARDIKASVLNLFSLLQNLSEEHKSVLMPGYTHLQVAMPSSFGLWFGAYAESLADDMELLAAAYSIINKNPLGSGAGYGSSFPLNRKTTTQLLHFDDLNYNSIYAQMSRFKAEKAMANALAGFAHTLSRLSMDICLFTSQNFGFVSFPDNLTTGSSIMPHKKNPDVFELVRARCNRIQAVANELSLLISNLPSGYHRDTQLSKEILFPAIESLKECLEIMAYMLQSIQVKENIIADDKYRYIFTVEKINKLVNEGISFREAYKAVGAEVEAGTFFFDEELQHTHEGSIGNLCTGEVKRLMDAIAGKIR